MGLARELEDVLPRLVFEEPEELLIIRRLALEVRTRQDQPGEGEEEPLVELVELAEELADRPVDGDIGDGEDVAVTIDEVRWHMAPPAGTAVVGTGKTAANKG